MTKVQGIRFMILHENALLHKLRGLRKMAAKLNASDADVEGVEEHISILESIVEHLQAVEKLVLQEDSLLRRSAEQLTDKDLAERIFSALGSNGSTRRTVV